MIAIKILVASMSCHRNKNSWLLLKMKQPSHWLAIIQNRLIYCLSQYVENLATSSVIGNTSLMELFEFLMELNTNTYKLQR